MHSCIKTLRVLINNPGKKLSSCDIGKLQTKFNKDNTVIKNICYIRKIFGDDLIRGTLNPHNGMMYYYLNQSFITDGFIRIKEVSVGSIEYMNEALKGVLLCSLKSA